MITDQVISDNGGLEKMRKPIYITMIPMSNWNPSYVKIKTLMTNLTNLASLDEDKNNRDMN